MAFAWLSLITIVGVASSFRGPIPLDARTGAPIADARLEMPLWASVVEPALAPFYVVAGAPDYQTAAISIERWLFVIVIAGFLIASRRRSLQRWPMQLLNSVLFATGTMFLFALYLLGALLIPLPSWSLVMDDPASVIVADLHSHTVASHDGIASIQKNLRVHRARGYDVVAITEHYSPELRSPEPVLALADARLPETIFGLEVGATIAGREYQFLLLGINPDLPMGHWLKTFADASLAADDPTLRNLIATVHRESNGAVLALAWNLREQDIARFIEAGIDGFEIANFGHPEFTQAIGGALVRAQRDHNIALVANSDWHGWGGLFKTWTVFRLSSHPGHKAGDVIEALRRRDPSRIVPVVSQVFEGPSAVRGFFAPFAEAFRYASELSLPRLASWWVWTGLAVLIAGGLRRLRLNPLGLFLIAAQTALGLCVCVRGVQLVAIWIWDGSLDYPLLIGSIALASGLLALVIAWPIRRIAVRSIIIPPWVK